MKTTSLYKNECDCGGKIIWKSSKRGKLIGHCDKCKSWIFKRKNINNGN
jgi:hypothetical protein